MKRFHKGGVVKGDTLKAREIAAFLPPVEYVAPKGALYFPTPLKKVDLPPGEKEGQTATEVLKLSITGPGSYKGTLRFEEPGPDGAHEKFGELMREQQRRMEERLFLGPDPKDPADKLADSFTELMLKGLSKNLGMTYEELSAPWPSPKRQTCKGYELFRTAYWTAAPNKAATTTMWARSMDHATWLVRDRGMGEVILPPGATFAVLDYEGERITIHIPAMQEAHMLPSELLRLNEPVKAMHAATWVSSIACASGACKPWDMLGDEGLLHRIAHVLETVYHYPSSYSAAARSEMLVLADRWAEFEDRVPGLTVLA